MSTAARFLLPFLCLFAFSIVTPAQQSPTTAEYCGDCHTSIYDGWKKSAHASAMESRLFQDALKMAQSELGESSRKVCLSCHSPVGVQIGDLELIRKVSWEGVTCEYCHSIREVTLGANPHAQVEFSNVKTGPWKDIISQAHGTAFSAVHTSSLVCISCHEYRNPAGLAVLTTYTEWKESPYAKEGKECQSCHMYNVRGDVVDPRVKRTAVQGVNLHEMPGSHSIDQLNRAIKASLAAERDGTDLRVTVKLTNAGGGHYVPTGSPLRRLSLELRVEPYGGQSFHEERVYARSVADQAGNPVSLEHIAFVKGAKVLKDTRLAPRETRTETFTFKLSTPRPTHVEVNLYYFYSPMARQEAQQKVRFLTLSRLIQ